MWNQNRSDGSSDEWLDQKELYFDENNSKKRMQTERLRMIVGTLESLIQRELLTDVKRLQKNNNKMSW